jgi:hypothetical protein
MRLACERSAGMLAQPLVLLFVMLWKAAVLMSHFLQIRVISLCHSRLRVTCRPNVEVGEIGERDQRMDGMRADYEARQMLCDSNAKRLS